MSPWPASEVLFSRWAAALALVLARVGGLTITAPAWGAPGLGWRLRVGLTLLVTLAILPAVEPSLSRPSRLGLPLAVGVGGEAAVGLAMGLAFALVLAAARQAGDLLGSQAGLAAAAVYDPDAGEGLTPLGHLYGLIALGVFVALDGPLRLVSTLIESYGGFPAGETGLTAESVGRLFAQVGWTLGLALRAAAPAGVALMAAGIALGLLARLGGALQMASLTWPLRAIVGTLLVLLTLGATIELFDGAWTRCWTHVPAVARPAPVSE